MMKIFLQPRDTPFTLPPAR